MTDTWLSRICCVTLVQQELVLLEPARELSWLHQTRPILIASFLFHSRNAPDFEQTFTPGHATPLSRSSVSWIPSSTAILRPFKPKLKTTSVLKHIFRLFRTRLEVFPAVVLENRNLTLTRVHLPEPGAARREMDLLFAQLL